MSDNLGYLSSDAVHLAFIFVCVVYVCVNMCVLVVLLYRLLAVFSFFFLLLTLLLVLLVLLLSLLLILVLLPVLLFETGSLTKPGAHCDWTGWRARGSFCLCLPLPEL